MGAKYTKNPHGKLWSRFPRRGVFRGLFMSDKLTEIMAWKRREIAPLLRPVSETELAQLDAALPRPPSFAAALRRPDGQLAVIAEIKRRSPSAGDIKAGASSLEQAQRYQAAGAVTDDTPAAQSFRTHHRLDVRARLAVGLRTC